MKSLTFVIPVYNEEKRIQKTLDALLAWPSLRFDQVKLEKVIFVDDGSRDNTVKIINKWIKSQSKSLRGVYDEAISLSSKNNGIATLQHPSLAMTKTQTEYSVISYSPNRGKGYAVRTGLNAANTDYTLFFDADMSTPLSEFKKFLPHIENNTDVIIGTRKNGHSTVIKHQPFYREQLGKCFTFLSNLILRSHVTDFTCGFKAFSKEAKERIFGVGHIDRWGYDSEIVFLAFKYKYKPQEVPVLWANDDRTKVNLLKDSFRSFSELISIRFFDLVGLYNSTHSVSPALSPQKAIETA